VPEIGQGGPGAGADFYNKALTAVKGSGLVGQVPKDGAQFGITTGSAEEWARFMTATAKAESNFNPRSANTSDPGGSFGVLQYAHGQVPGGNAYNTDASIQAFIRDAMSSTRSGSLRGGILGQRFSTIGRHPERTIRNLANYGDGGATTGAGGAPSIPMMEGDITGSGRGSGGRFNVRAGSGMIGEHEQITLANGQRVTVNRRAASQFQGFFNDLIAAGAPVRNLGGFGSRPGNPSQHPIGLAIDWAQHSRNVVDRDVAQWMRSNAQTLNTLEQKWGMSGGEHWRNPDTGHFSIDTLFGSRHLAALRAGAGGRADTAQAFSGGGGGAGRIGGAEVNIHVTAPRGHRVTHTARGHGALAHPKVKTSQTAQMRSAGQNAQDDPNRYGEE